MSQVRLSQTKKSLELRTKISVPVTSVHKVEADGVRVFYGAARYGEPEEIAGLMAYLVSKRLVGSQTPLFAWMAAKSKESRMRFGYRLGIGEFSSREAVPRRQN